MLANINSKKDAAFIFHDFTANILTLTCSHFSHFSTLLSRSTYWPLPPLLGDQLFILQMELAFMTGDVIYVFGEMDEDGFYMGQCAATGSRGLVPSNFLAEATPDPLSLQQQQMHQLQQQQQQQHVSQITEGSSPRHDFRDKRKTRDEYL